MQLKKQILKTSAYNIDTFGFITLQLKKKNQQGV